MNVTEHFSLEEFACKDSTPYPIGNLDEITGATWMTSRLVPLCDTLERVRARLARNLGEDVAVYVSSGYRSPAYNGALSGAAKDSQHMRGRAADVKVFTGKGAQRRQVDPGRVHDTVLVMHLAGEMPHLGGLGRYPEFTHIDTRPRPEDDHLARWNGTRKSNRI